MGESIYKDRAEVPFDLKDRVAYYAMEAEACERLLTMGYTHSNGVDLTARQKELEKLIADTERLIKLKLN